MNKYKIKRRCKTIKTKYIFIACIIGMLFISMVYARYSTELTIHGTATGTQQQLSVLYLNIPGSSSAPSTIGYMSTYTYTFASPPTITSITMGGTTLTLNTDYTYVAGTLTIPNVTGTLVIEGEAEDYTMTYHYGNNVEFDGASIMDTGIALFSVANLRRDFDVTVDIDSVTYDSTQHSGFNTIVNAVNHSAAPYHGFLLRRDSTTGYFKYTEYQNGENIVSQATCDPSDIHYIRIKRMNDILYADLNTGTNLTPIGDFSNFTESFNWHLLVGADSDSNNPLFRCLTGTLSNITVKLYYEGTETSITLPTPTRTGYTFDGWYSNSNLTTKVGNGGASYTPSGNTTLYAKWTKNQSVDDNKVAEVNGTKYTSLQAAVNAVPTNDTETIVKLLKNTSETISVKAHQNIKFNFQTYTLSNKGNNKVIDNKGTITITNGELTSSGGTIIDNQSGGVLKIQGGRLIATGSKQAVYNYGGGRVEISGDVYISSATTGTPGGATIERATVQNLANGTMTITGGTIVGTNQQAVSNSGNLTIGTKDGSIDTTTPIFRGKTYGIKSEGTLNFYDGIAKGITGAISGTINDKETNSQIQNGSEVIGTDTYITGYLVSTN